MARLAVDALEVPARLGGLAGQGKRVISLQGLCMPCRTQGGISLCVRQGREDGQVCEGKEEEWGVARREV